jgi:hypothetical protein
MLIIHRDTSFLIMSSKLLRKIQQGPIPAFILSVIIGEFGSLLSRLLALLRLEMRACIRRKSGLTFKSLAVDRSL